MKGIDNILKPLYDLWHKVMDKMSVVKDRVVIDGHEVVVKFIVENIKALTDAQCEALQCGDVVAKITGNQFHCYKVTYKEDKHGLVLSYMDASLIEGQSYDYVEGHWVYNSEDKTEFSDLGHTDNEVKALAVDAVEAANSGTIADSLGLDSSGNLVKGTIEPGKKLYKHKISFSCSTLGAFSVYILSEKSTAYQNFDDIVAPFFPDLYQFVRTDNGQYIGYVAPWKYQNNVNIIFTMIKVSDGSVVTGGSYGETGYFSSDTVIEL